MKKLFASSKGQILVFVAITLVVLLALAGLAIDVGMAYAVKTKLNAAVDSAAIAAGRAVSQGSAAASTQATNFFNANYPPSLLGSTVTAPVTNAVHNGDGSWTICNDLQSSGYGPAIIAISDLNYLILSGASDRN
jgi:Flp pilus assembly protein TadG